MHLTNFQGRVLQESHLHRCACQNIMHLQIALIRHGAASHYSGLLQPIQLISEELANDLQILMAMWFSAKSFLAQHMQGHSATKATKGSHFSRFSNARGSKQCPGITQILPQCSFYMFTARKLVLHMPFTNESKIYEMHTSGSAASTFSLKVPLFNFSQSALLRILEYPSCAFEEDIIVAHL